MSELTYEIFDELPAVIVNWTLKTVRHAGNLHGLSVTPSTVPTYHDLCLENEKQQRNELAPVN